MIESAPLTLAKVAVTVTSPAATAVTTPAEDTVASALLDVAQVADAVTSCVDPSAIVAIALNWEVLPTAGAAPVTASDDTVDTVDVVVDGVEGELLHAASDTASPTARAKTLIDRTIRTP